LSPAFPPGSKTTDIFTAVQSQHCTHGVVPFENSTNGNVVFTLDLFCDRSGANASVRVSRETYLTVHHCLLSTATSPSQITKLYSHPQAFGQCELFLTAHLKGVERIDVSSTSKAAQLAKPDPTAAAIASKIAAEVHGLTVLAENIEDAPDNTTRFFIISSSAASVAPPLDGGKGNKTLLSFTIDHAQPGALCDSLTVFKDFGLNLTSIASRPSRLLPWNYIFFVEFEGHMDTENVQAALVELGRYTAEMRVLGSYVDMQKLRRREEVKA
jgi:prephenate dehydratase